MPQGLPDRRHGAQRVRHRPRPEARVGRDHDGAAPEARPRGAPGRHGPRAQPRPELRHPVLADGRRAGRVDRAARRLLPAVHVLGWGTAEPARLEQRRRRAPDRHLRGRDRARDPRPDRRPARPAGRQPPARVPRGRVGRRADPQPGTAWSGRWRRSRSTTEPLEVANRATQHLYFENPIKARRRASSRACSRPIRRPSTGSTACARCQGQPPTRSRTSSACVARPERPSRPSGPPAPPPGPYAQSGSDVPRRVAAPGACCLSPVRGPCYSPPRRRALRGTRDRAEIAQLVEHATENRGVASSNLALGTTTWSVIRAEVAQLVEHHLAKVRVAGSSPVFRSISPRIELDLPGTAAPSSSGRTADFGSVSRGSNPRGAANQTSSPATRRRTRRRGEEA